MFGGGNFRTDDSYYLVILKPTKLVIITCLSLRDISPVIISFRAKQDEYFLNRTGVFQPGRAGVTNLFRRSASYNYDRTSLKGVQSVRIINMRVPEVIQYGTRDAVTLDCDYITGNVTGLVVKWFFMDTTQPVYQWIPPQKPQALGLLKNKLDLSYKVSRNPYMQHRALRILNPGLELTGNYTCVISTFLAEDQRTKPMTIFVPERRFDMIQDRLGDGYLNIICSAEGVYPKPELIILAGNRPLHAKSQIKLINDRYTIVTSSIIKVDSLPPTVEILCDMQVPLANYFSRKRDLFYRDPPPTTPDPPNSAHSQAKDRGHRLLSLPNMVVISISYLIRKHIT